MSGAEDTIFDACDCLIKDLNALEEAIVEVCPFGMRVEIWARRKEIWETKE